MDQLTRRAEKTNTKPPSEFRTDINGLRALAVVPVVAFHAGLLAIPGGFIGVDIFYVISGFLITGILVRQAEAGLGVALGSFWAQRLRRLVPALALVVVVTVPIFLLTSSPLVWGNLGRDALASITYVSNIVFAFDATDYFADDLTQSPFLHTWSLSVEEQFYVLWPLIVLLVLLIAARTKYALRPLLVVAFSAVIVISLVLSIVLTEFRQGMAFYLLPARAWEFAAGGLLSILPAALLSRARALSGAFSFAGVAVLVGGFLMIHDNDPFPGFLAAVPVVGTLLVIAAGGGLPQKTIVSSLLDSGIMQWLGTRSYSWYLWHWPTIVLAGVFFQSDSIWLKVAAAFVSLGLAALTHKFVENRFRESGSLQRSTNLTFRAAGASLLIVSMIAGAALVAGRFMTANPPYAKFAQARAVVSSQGCDRSTSSAGGHALCEMGAVDSQKTIMLIGDSHAGQWKAALSEAAAQEGTRLLVRWKSACPVSGLNVITANGNLTKGCPEFHAETLAIAQEQRPGAIILAQSVDYAGRIRSYDGGVLAEQEQSTLWRTALGKKIGELRATGAQVGYIEDNPGTSFDSVLCETRILPMTKDCTARRDDVLSEPLRAVDSEVVARAGVTVVYSPTEVICDPVRCNVIGDGGVPIYRDRTHLSEQWTKTQLPQLRALIASLMESPQS